MIYVEKQSIRVRVLRQTHYLRVEYYQDRHPLQKTLLRRIPLPERLPPPSSAHVNSTRISYTLQFSKFTRFLLLAFFAFLQILNLHVYKILVSNTS